VLLEVIVGQPPCSGVRQRNFDSIVSLERIFCNRTKYINQLFGIIL